MKSLVMKIVYVTGGIAALAVCLFLIFSRHAIRAGLVSDNASTMILPVAGYEVQIEDCCDLDVRLYELAEQDYLFLIATAKGERFGQGYFLDMTGKQMWFAYFPGVYRSVADKREAVADVVTRFGPPHTGKLDVESEEIRGGVAFHMLGITVLEYGFDDKPFLAGEDLLICGKRLVVTKRAD